MSKKPEELSSIGNPESQDRRLSSVFSSARRLKTLSEDVIDFYKRQSLTGKVSMGFLGFTGVDLTQVVVNRGILHFDPVLATIELISDIGVVSSANNLVDSRFKKLAMINGSLGILSSTLAKTGNPDLVMPALIIAGLSAAMATAHMLGNHDLSSSYRII